MNITEEYIQYHNKYTTAEYKNIKVLVLMQVGSFYEAYSTDTSGPNLQEISGVLNIICTKRDKKDKTVSLKNPYMLGFPKVAEAKFINVLIENNYTVVVIDQVTAPPDPKREVTNIYSPGVYINGTQKPDNNYVIGIYIEEEKQKSGGINILCAGMTAIDITTGNVLINEVYSSSSDVKYSLDETTRFINSINPSEIVVYINHSDDINKKEILKYLDFDGNDNSKKILHIRDKINPKYFKIGYQNEYLKNVYKDCGMVQPIDYLDLERYSYTVISMIMLLDFLYLHNKTVINCLDKPQVYYDAGNMILGNNCINQLNIVDNTNINSNNSINHKYKSLFDVVNNTTCAMGRRLLRSRLTLPLISSKKLNQEYDFITELLQNNLYLEIEKHLKNIADIERLERKIILEQINPFEFVQFIESCQEVQNLVSKIKQNKCLKKILTTEINFDFIADFYKTFNVNNMNCLLNEMCENIFIDRTLYPVMTALDDKIQNYNGFLDKLCSELCKYIDTKDKQDLIKIKLNSNGGHFLQLTKNRSVILKKNLQDKNIRTIIIGDYCLDVDKIIFKDIKKMTNIILSDDLMERSEEINELKQDMMTQSKINFIKQTNKIYVINKTNFENIRTFVSYLDLYKSNAKTSHLYNYFRPTIDSDNKSSFIDCKQLRHPIIERIIDYEYVPHDIALGKDTKGILLYGLNSSGKSSIMKALGMCLIMAQAGMFVPAKKCTYYPYTSLYTRITSNDNLFKGLSSFSLEMLELKAILNRARDKTLVIGDEICRGTENISANAIVATSIIKLSEYNTSFIFATHLHDIAELPRIKALSNVKNFHLAVSYDNNKDCLVYDRKLKEGPGENIYGITVAKYILKDKSFIDMALDIKNEMLQDYGSLISGKTSKYNSNVFVYECQLCGEKDIKGHISNLQTHHINEQHEFVNGISSKKPHVKKNDKANLVTLCIACHNKIHHDGLEINKIMTSNGKQIVKTSS